VSTPYRIQITARAARDLQHLPEKIATACAEFIFGPLAENPWRVGKPLANELTGLHSARRGDYRIIYAINKDTRHIEIMHIQQRRLPINRPPR
jgi:mRNA-degrading endonuclease RelE of RelBE toxin-antitoxin system